MNIFQRSHLFTIKTPRPHIYSIILNAATKLIGTVPGRYERFRSQQAEMPDL